MNIASLAALSTTRPMTATERAGYVADRQTKVTLDTTSKFNRFTQGYIHGRNERTRLADFSEDEFYATGYAYGVTGELD